MEKKRVVQEKLAQGFAMILDALGVDCNDASLQDTPQRCARLWLDELGKFYTQQQKPEVFFEKRLTQPATLHLKGIPFRSVCQHHLLPFWGTIDLSVTYSNNKLLGLSKFYRFIDYFTSQLSLQEELTEKLGQAIVQKINASALSLTMTAKHGCILFRGVKDRCSSVTTTWEYRG